MLVYIVMIIGIVVFVIGIGNGVSFGIVMMLGFDVFFNIGCL